MLKNLFFIFIGGFLLTGCADKVMQKSYYRTVEYEASSRNSLKKPILIITSKPLQKKSSRPTEWFVSTGYNFSQGDYGRSKPSSAHYVPLSVRMQKEKIAARLTVPYVFLRGTGIGLDGVPSASITDSEEADGMGNVQASLSYRDKINNHGTSAEILGRVELPTADSSRRLGADSTSFMLQAGINQGITQKAFVGVNAGRKFVRSTRDYPMNDTWKVGASAGYRVHKDVTVGVNAEARTPSSDAAKPYQVGTAYVQYRVNPDMTVQGYIGAGFTDSSPDMMTGVEVTRKVNLDWAKPVQKK